MVNRRMVKYTHLDLFRDIYNDEDDIYHNLQMYLMMHSTLLGTSVLNSIQPHP